MSLFIGALAFPGNAVLADEAKVGILAGSIASAIAGFLILRFGAPAGRSAGDDEEMGELFAADFDQ
jgi:NhaA family Na+:H+ antiporter